MKNLVILIGNCGKDPEVKSTNSGKKVATLSLATSESYKNKQGERVNNTEWHNLVVWSPLAEIFEKYVKKGDQIYVEGKLTTRSYEKDGDKKYITEVAVKELTMLGSKEHQRKEVGAKDPRTEPNKTMVDDLEEDSLPF